MTPKKKGQSLEEFLDSMTEKITYQQESMLRGATILVDLSQELSDMIMDLMEQAKKSREDLGEAHQKIALHHRLGAILEDEEEWIEKAWTAKGQCDGYLYAVTKIKALCETVMERQHETKH